MINENFSKMCNFVADYVDYCNNIRLFCGFVWH